MVSKSGHSFPSWFFHVAAPRSWISATQWNLSGEWAFAELQGGRGWVWRRILFRGHSCVCPWAVQPRLHKPEPRALGTGQPCPTVSSSCGSRVALLWVVRSSGFIHPDSSGEPAQPFEPENDNFCSSHTSPPLTRLFFLHPSLNGGGLALSPSSLPSQGSWWAVPSTAGLQLDADKPQMSFSEPHLSQRLQSHVPVCTAVQTLHSPQALHTPNDLTILSPKSAISARFPVPGKPRSR